MRYSLKFMVFLCVWAALATLAFQAFLNMRGAEAQRAALEATHARHQFRIASESRKEASRQAQIESQTTANRTKREILAKLDALLLEEAE